MKTHAVRKRSDDRHRMEAYLQSCALAEHIGSCHDPKRVTEYWHRTFNCVAKVLGFDRTARRVLWTELVAGSWPHLEQTESERQMDAEDWLTNLKYDVLYCSDRWTFGRLTRCHWEWRQYVEAAEADA